MKRLILILSLLATPALALEPINKDPRINESLIAGRVGDTIRNICPTISARMVVVYSKLKELERYARDKGYSEADFDALRKNEAEKNRMKAKAAEYLKAAGAVEGNAESYCKVGRDEIAKGSLIGELLRSSQ
ncbi:MAG: DUF5333 domain-containing protein [Paracoccaceae bacterium]